MGSIDDERIVSAIIRCLEGGINSFVIYPYGVKGKRVKEILNEEFEVAELAVVDNRLSNEDKNVLCLDDLEKIKEDYVILLSSDNKEIWYELRNSLQGEFGNKIIDIAEEEKKIGSGFSYLGRKMQIDICNREQIEKVFERTQKIWRAFGEQDPYWSVVTHDEFKSQNINKESIDKFYAQGQREIVKITSILKRNNKIENWSDLKNLDIVEIGCGCGRITKKLARLFKKVMAIDISKGNLEIAKQAVTDKNVEFFLMTNVDDYGKLPKVDVVYSYIVLQHNCPPVIEYIITSMLQCLKSHGTAIFQVPTYKGDYQFDYNRYINEEIRTDMVEMHVLPQKRIFEIAYDNGCIPLEVHPDDSTGQADESRLFVFEKE